MSAVVIVTDYEILGVALLVATNLLALALWAAYDYGRRKAYREVDALAAQLLGGEE